MIGQRAVKEARYWNFNGHGVCIIAVITEGIDWAAYIGADDGFSEADCIKFTIDFGAKLSSQDALHFFPEIELPYRN